MALRSARYGYYVLALLGSANLLHYASRNVVFHSAVLDDLRGAFDLSNAELGFFGSMAFMIPHALATLPVGWLGDRFDRRRVMAGGVVLWSAGAALGALSTGYATLLISRAVVGIGCAACVPVANALICDVFPAEGKARTISLFNLGLFLGGVVGFAAGGMFGFPASLVVVGLPGLALAYLIATMDVPSQPIAAGDSSRMSVRGFARDLASAFRVRTLRWMFIGAILMAFAAGGYVGWFVEFLTKTKNMTEGQATAFFGVLLVGGLAGVVIGAALSDKLFETRPYGRQLAVVIGFACAVPCALVAIYTPRGPVFYVSAFLLLFFSMWYHGPIAAAVDDLVPQDRAATSQGVYIFLMHLVGTAPSAWVVGWVVDRWSLEHALLLPTFAMALAAVGFAMSCPGVSRDLVSRR